MTHAGDVIEFQQISFVKRNLLIRCPPLWERSNPDLHALGRMLCTMQLKKRGNSRQMIRCSPAEPCAGEGKKNKQERERAAHQKTISSSPSTKDCPRRGGRDTDKGLHREPKGRRDHPASHRQKPTQGREKANWGGERMTQQNTFPSSPSSQDW